MTPKVASAAAVLLLCACKPPATDDFNDRRATGEATDGPSVPAESPDIEGALWAAGNSENRLLYGQPGKQALLSLSCAGERRDSKIVISRFVAADAEATALMAVIGNGHIARLPVEAEWNGKVWIWEGRYWPGRADLAALSGPRTVELTIPGAGSVTLNPSQRPGDLIAACQTQLEEPQLEEPHLEEAQLQD